MLGKEVPSDEDRHPSRNFAHRFKEGEAAVHLHRFIRNAGRTRRNEALREEPVCSQMKIREKNLSLAQQSELRFERFLDLHDQIRPGKSLFVRLNDFRARGLVV